MHNSRRKSQGEESEGAPEWLLTYSDLVTLLLTFFIMLFSMATVDNQKFVEVANSLRSQFLHMGGNGELFNTNQGKDLVSLFEEDSSSVNSSNDPEIESQDDEALVNQANMVKARKLQEIKEKLEEAIVKLGLKDNVSIIEESDIITLRLDSIILFDLGSAEISSSGKEILNKLGVMLRELDNEIMIKGHTDNLPINNSEFPSNWELSTKRATNVVLFLVDTCKLDPKELTATGNGEFRPIKPNNTEENRQKNRRIDIIIEK